jgi:3,4-dihydroxy 2-butanone 4-phosphate synthase/GTP cyclohydrolase II
MGSSPKDPSGSCIDASPNGSLSTAQRFGERQDFAAAVAAAVAALSAGEIVVVSDDLDRKDEGDLICPAESMTTERMAFYLRYGSGLVCTPMTDSRATNLGLDPMVSENTEKHQTAFTVTVDHVDVATGISASDRARTVRALADPQTRRQDLRRPGHVFPLRSRAGGTLKRAGHTEAAIDLLQLAGASDVGAITELVGTDGVPLAGHGVREFAREHDLPYLAIADLIRYRRQVEPLGAWVGKGPSGW